jgi:hypothetical protein
MSLQFGYAKMKSFEDFVRFVTVSTIPFIQYVELAGKHVYFIQILGFGGGRMVYYYEREKKVEEKYVVVNRFRDQLSFSNTFSSDGHSAFIPILELERTNIFPDYPPK